MTPVLRAFLFAYVCLVTAAGVLPATTEVQTLGVGEERPLAPHFVGLNGNVMAFDRPWRDHAVLLEGFRATNAALFRYPAGTIANTWDWEEGRLDQDVPDEELIDWVVLERRRHPDKRYPLEDLALLYRETGTEVAFVLNMLTRDLDHALRGLRRARDLGLPVRYVEMGNELFFNLPLESRVHPTPEDYGRRCGEWIRAIKAEFPGVKCGIVAGGRPTNPRSARWTERALAACPEADAIIVHTYSPSGLMGRVRRDITAGTEGTVEGVPELPIAERQQLEMERLRAPEGPAKMFTTAYDAARRQRDYARRPEMEIWMTEWNLRGDQDAVRGTWANALFIATFYQGFLENPAITLSHYHNVVSPIFGAFHINDEGLSHVVGLTLKTEPGALTAGGLATAIVAQALNGQTVIAPLLFREPGELIAEEQRMPARFGWRADGAQGRTLLLLNLAAEPSIVDVTAQAPAGASATVWAAALDTYVATRTSVTPHVVALTGPLTLPPHSLAVIRVRAP